MGHLGALIGLIYILFWTVCSGLPKCKWDEYTCANSRCVPSGFLCDKVDDCGDRSDEVSCGSQGLHLAAPSITTHTSCGPSEFHCGNGACIPHAFRCDYSEDCADGSDEENCEKDECQENNGGCSHICVDQPLGVLCACPPGMMLVGDTQCEEIDECLSSDVCSQICVHVNGTLTCECHKGYETGSNPGECTANGDRAVIAFSSSAGLQSVDTLGQEYRQVAVASSTTSGPVAVLVANQTLYWASSEQGTIFRTSLEGHGHDPVLLLRSPGTILGLSVDWIHHLLYWTNINTHSVSVASLDGSQRRLLVGGISRPTGVAVEPLEGLLFWADAGISPRIERASLDGRGRTALVTTALQNPVAIALDLPRKLLYWTDAGRRSISRVNFDGRLRKTVLESNGYLDLPYGLAVFEGHVFWSDQASGTVCRASKHNGSSTVVLLGQMASPAGLAVVHPVLQSHGQQTCGLPRRVCLSECVLELFSEVADPSFNCVSPTDSPRSASHYPSLTSDLPDISFAWMLSIIVLLSLLLVGLLWCWRLDLLRIPSLHVSNSLRESQNPLMPATSLDNHNHKETA